MTWVYVLIGLLIVAGVQAGGGPLIPGTGQIIAGILLIMLIAGLARL